jgi:NAD(P)-dependent dehydrogenase (short-subunit alcohol dehydrogenase family)
VNANNQVFTYNFNEAGLAGRTLLLAGGSGGLGAATAALLARDGASLVIGYHRDRERAEALRSWLAERHETPVELVGGDIFEGETRARFLTAAERLSAEVYGLVCLVGDPARVKFESASESDLETSLRRNYLGPILLARDVAASLRKRRVAGTIVLFSTMQAVECFPSSLNYAGPKAALIHAARILAKDWGGPEGIRVNVVAPGVNRAGMALASIESGKYDHFVDRGIIPRFGRAEDVARVVRLLVEPDNYVTGQVITVDGGLTLRKDLG